MYVIITRASGHRVTVSATAGTDRPEGTRDMRSALLGPPEQVDRTTGAIQAMSLVVNAERTFAAAVAATRPAPSLTGHVAGVLTHPGIGRLLTVGPFESPTALDRWWNWPRNRLTQAGVVCLLVALPAYPPDTTGATR